MNIESLRDYTLSLPFVEEKTPFGDDHLCYCLEGRMFLMIDVADHAMFANLKCQPELAVELREHYNGIVPGWHMNKRHWNSVYYQSDVNDGLFLRLVRHAYNCLLATLPASVRAKIDPLDE